MSEPRTIEVPWINMGTADIATLHAYAEASGDRNPIHLDREVARNMGLPDLIAHGMLSCGWLVERARQFILEQRGSDHFISMRTRFKDITLQGERVECGGQAVRTKTGWRLELQARTNSGKITTDTVIEFGTLNPCVNADK